MCRFSLLFISLLLCLFLLLCLVSLVSLVSLLLGLPPGGAVVAGFAGFEVWDGLFQLLPHLVKRGAEGREGYGGEGGYHGDAMLHWRVVQDGLDLLYHIQTILERREGGRKREEEVREEEREDGTEEEEEEEEGGSEMEGIRKHIKAFQLK